VSKGISRRGIGLLLCVLALLAGCKSPASNSDAEEPRLIVFAATSLREGFSAMGAEFRRLHPGVEISFNFAGTQELRTQIEQGAAADVFASADQRHMDALLNAGLVTEARPFARNEPVMVVAKESEATLRSLADLPRAERIVIGTPEVPIGRYTLEILDRASATLGADFRANVEAKVVSRELNVRQVLSKVSLGEAQAGVVYRTDAQTALGRVNVVGIPSEVNTIAEYPIALVTDAPHAQLGRAWLDFTLSTAGQRCLRAVGFLAPTGASPGPATPQ
jgi:molybdate transport system substrate-binding protein